MGESETITFFYVCPSHRLCVHNVCTGVLLAAVALTTPTLGAQRGMTLTKGANGLPWMVRDQLLEGDLNPVEVDRHYRGRERSRELDTSKQVSKQYLVRQ